MTEERKYYTPGIDELHVGFEMEFLSDCKPESGVVGLWCKLTVPPHSSFDEFQEHINQSFIRVPYLDKQGIEELGWKWGEKPPHFSKLSRYIFGDTHSFIFNKLTCGCTIFQEDRFDNNGYWSPPVQVFTGIIRNKSELKRIMRQTGITQ